MDTDNRAVSWPCAISRVVHLCSSVFICGYTAFCITPSTAASISITDDLGRKVELKAPARRIVSLSPFLTELAFSAGAGDRLVAVSAHSDYPPEAKRLPQVASAVAISMEPLIALEPDLVLAWRDTTRPEDVARLESLRIPVFVTQAKRLEDVPRLLAAVAALAGTDSSAAGSRYRARLDVLRRTYGTRERVRVFLEIWHRPLTTIAGPHWMNEALALCGADNAFADLPGVAPVVPWETVFARDPQAIVGAGSAASESEFRTHWEARPTLAAVRARRLVYIEPDLIQRPTLRLADGVERLCRGIDQVR